MYVLNKCIKYLFKMNQIKSKILFRCILLNAIFFCNSSGFLVFLIIYFDVSKYVPIM